MVPTATDLVCHVLRRVRSNEGSEAATREAQELITASAAILSREAGLAVALATLADAAVVTKMTN
jgi:hypothetical protein